MMTKKKETDEGEGQAEASEPSPESTGKALPESNPDAAKTFAQLVQFLEDGDLHKELSDKLQEIHNGLRDHALAFGGKPKGQLALKLDFKLDAGVFEIVASVSTKLPEAPRGRTVAWATETGHFSASNPRQLGLFGKPKVVDGESTEVKTI